MYKLFATDMDGTLLNSNHEITDHTIKSLKKIKELGLTIVLCTGRPINGLAVYKEQLSGLVDYTISYNGGLIEDVHNDKILHKCFLDYEQVVQLHDLSKQLNVSMHFYDENNLYTSNRKISRYTVVDSYLSNTQLHYCELNELSTTANYPKVLFVDDPENLNGVIENIPKEYYQQYTIVQSEKFFLEFVHKNTNKGIAVEYLANLLNINANEVITFGDNENDISMLTYAGCGVVMENANEQIKKHADYQTLTNNQNGVAHAIEKLIIKNKN